MKRLPPVNEHNTTNLCLLLAICKTTQQTLLTLERSMAGTSLPLWQARVAAARADYVELVVRLGMPREVVEAELARELGDIPPRASGTSA